MILASFIALCILVALLMNYSFTLDRKISEASAKSEKAIISAVNALTKSVLSTSELEWENILAEDLHDAQKLIEQYIGPHIARHTPPLRKLIKLSAGFETSDLQRRYGLLLDDLPRAALSSTQGMFWPVDMDIEVWSTHMVIKHPYGPTVRVCEALNSSYDIKILWCHEIDNESLAAYSNANIEVVLHDNSIKVWLIHGKFDVSNPWMGTAREKNTLVSLPLNDLPLSEYRQTHDNDIPDDMQPRDRAWVRRYYKESETHRWHMVVTDLVEYYRR